MYCCTFYSYKGGVGRTLALANVAAQLAKFGRKVLVVDFDLEAPGLSTLKLFDRAIDQPGLIDFVRAYLVNGEVPDASSFVYECKASGPDYSFNIDIMPAGSGGADYSEAYSSIDWSELYESMNGFLLMEDLRAQWERAGYDYVFIDSRTGHTDAGGICTRQLPDAVAVVFFPNLQNLRGLEKTVPSIRSSQGRPQAIETIFVASRIPKLDDEHGLLKGLLEKFQSGLSYRNDDLVILEQYDSLSLLDQELFTLTRPRSGLARQYIELATRISQLNVEDPNGASAYLKSELRGGRRGAEPAFVTSDFDEQVDDSQRLKRISDVHEKDALIQLLLARIYYDRRSMVDAAIATDNALAADLQTRVSEPIPSAFLSRVNQLRLRIFSELDVQETVIAAAEAIISSPDASDTAILDAISHLANSDSSRLVEIGQLPALANASAERLFSVAQRLTWSAEAMELSASLIERIFNEFPNYKKFDQSEITELQLPLIATQRFELAYKIFEDLPPSDSVRLDVLFNSAMAKWGRDKEPDLSLLQEVYAHFANGPRSASEANHSECRALVEGLLGMWEEMKVSLDDAKRKVSKRIEFSCWNYLNVGPLEFKEHLDKILEYFENDGEPPAFLGMT